jgi:ubiquinone/menaquinone biosynthesis C-methylase UbiE
MPNLPDSNYLKFEQYKDANRLKARILLHQKFSTNQYGWFRWVFDQFDLPADIRILEIGCGSGTLWLDNKDRIPPGWRIFLSDISSGMVVETKSKLEIYVKQVSYEIFTGTAIPFLNHSFDTVIANHMLYHIKDRKKALAEINRVLKPEGTFYASTIGKNHLKELSQLTASCKLAYPNYYSPALNPNGFTLENGSHQLNKWFKKLSINLYPDALIVTEAKPLINYILSMLSSSEISNNKEGIESLSRQINRIIKHQGSIYIQKSSGIFIGRKDKADND